MPRAARRLAAAQRVPGDIPRPPGVAPPDHPIWDGTRGVWTNNQDEVRPAMSRAERLNEQRRKRRCTAASRRDDDAAHGSEFFGLHVRIPWAGWGGEYAGSDEYSTGTIVDYVSQPKERGRHFCVAFDPGGRRVTAGADRRPLRVLVARCGWADVRRLLDRRPPSAAAAQRCAFRWQCASRRSAMGLADVRDRVRVRTCRPRV